MKIAVPYNDGNIGAHFGSSEFFAIYEAESGKITKKEIIAMEGGGHGFIPMYLNRIGINTVICGGLGRPMAERIRMLGMELIAGTGGNADQAVQDYLEGKLAYREDAIHEGGHGHH